jgi:hypothetical protein
VRSALTALPSFGRTLAAVHERLEARAQRDRQLAHRLRATGPRRIGDDRWHQLRLEQQQ